MDFDPRITVDVPDDVYSPSDDSFLLLKCVQVSPGETFLEVGCGSGLVSLHAAKAGARVTAVDISPVAVDCTRRNALKNDVKVTVLQSDLFEKVQGVFDVIAFNPPYLPDESSTTSTSWIERSWSGGAEGSEVTVRFIEEVWKHLAPRGRVYVVLSSLGGLMSVLKAGRQRFESRMIEEKHMFFESIYVYEFVLRARQDDNVSE